MLEAVRVHNGDGVVAAVSVHTAEMPNSMAWVSGAARCPGAKQRTCQRMHCDSCPCKSAVPHVKASVGEVAVLHPHYQVKYTQDLTMPGPGAGR